MSEEDKAMMARISQLAGHINRHKNQQSGIVPTSSYNHCMVSPYWRRQVCGADVPEAAGPGKTWYRGSGPYHRGRVGKPAPHRHRSLILNGSLQANKSDIDSGATSDASTSSWVTKNDRHLQLINSSVYEKETQARTKAIEQTRLQKQQQKNDHERAKLMRHFSHVANSGSIGAGATNDGPAARYEVVVDGVRFYVTKSGSKLVKVPGVFEKCQLAVETCTHECEGDHNSLNATPKMAVVGGVKFYRSKNGNLYRHGIVKAQRQSGVVKKVDQPCRIFSSTGSCPKGPQCRYIHDPSKVAACKDFLQKGECMEEESCDLSHDLTPQRTPYCLHFAKGNCTNPDCRYTHVKVSAGGLVCRPFGIYGYCQKGAHCSDRHIYECPDFSNTGICKSKNCKLLHRERASVLRKANAREAKSDADMADVSSDDEESIDSDDVDSDEVEEFFGDDDGLDHDLAIQKDFIEL